jgi:hypothetical protein
MPMSGVMRVSRPWRQTACRMIAGGNWWRATEIVIRHPIRQTATRSPCRDRAGEQTCKGTAGVRIDRLRAVARRPH